MSCHGRSHVSCVLRRLRNDARRQVPSKYLNVYIKGFLKLYFPKFLQSTSNDMPAKYVNFRQIVGMETLFSKNVHKISYGVVLKKKSQIVLRAYCPPYRYAKYHADPFRNEGSRNFFVVFAWRPMETIYI